MHLWEPLQMNRVAISLGQRVLVADVERSIDGQLHIRQQYAIERPLEPKRVKIGSRRDPRSWR